MSIVFLFDENPNVASSWKVVESKLTNHHENESIQGRDRHRFLTWNWRRRIV